jgi:hypothetical protein
MTADRSRLDLTHVAGGTTLVLTYLNLIPGFLPTLVLVGLLVALVLLPALVLGLAAAVVMGPPYGVWWLLTRRRRR